ncbi:hypothetical protein [Nocardia sp. X0981]
MSRNSNQLSVAELLARNGQQPTTGGGGRRRRGGGGISVDELSGDLPAVDSGGSAHAAPDTADSATESGVSDGAADSGYAAQSYAGAHVPDAENSPMSGPITVYNPLEPSWEGPARLGEPGAAAHGSPFTPEDDTPRRSGRRRRAEPDDAESYGADDVQTPQPWDVGPPPPSGGRAARRRAAEAAEAAEAATQVAHGPASESPSGYGWAPPADDFGRFPAPSAEFGTPDIGTLPGPDTGPPRLAPPDAAPPTEVWSPPGPTPADDPRPKLERRRRGARPLPEPAPWPEEPAFDGDSATTVWPLAEQGHRPHPPAQPLEAGPEDMPYRGGRGAPGLRHGPAGPVAPPPAPGFAEPIPAPEFDSETGFGDIDSYATDVYGPMRPAPGPLPREERSETGEFEPVFDPESDAYPDPDDSPSGGSRLDRGRAALKGKLGAAGGKFAATRSRFAGVAREPDDEAADPRKQWMVLGAQSVGAALAGMLLFKGFEQLWERQPLPALALAVVVILGLVALVRILRRTDDIFSTVIAVVVGVFVTLGPLAFLLSTG